MKSADFNGDYRVDGMDLLTLLSNLGRLGNLQTDLNDDGRTDSMDVLLFAQQWNRRYSPDQ